MTLNLQQQYESIDSLVEDYQQFIRKLFWRILRPSTYFKGMRLFMKLFLSGDQRRQKEKMAEFTREMADLIYTPDEKKSDFYPIAVNAYPLHHLSCLLEKNHPDFAYGHLLKVHEISDLRIKRSNPFELFGYALGASSLLSKTVPQAVVESFGVDYTQYQITTFWGLVFALVYIGFIVAVWYSTHFKTKQRRKITKEVIEYTAARFKAQNPD